MMPFMAQAAVMAAPSRPMAMPAPGFAPGQSHDLMGTQETGAPDAARRSRGTRGADWEADAGPGGTAPRSPGGGNSAGGFGGSSAGGRMSPSPRFAPPAAPRPAGHSLDSVRPQLVVELDRLRALLGGPDPLYLADLGSRLSALAAFLGGHPELDALARELQTAELPGADAEALRTHAIEVLTALTSGSPSTPSGSPAPGTPRRPFWKRT